MSRTSDSQGHSRNPHGEPPLATKLPDFLAKRIDFTAPQGCWHWLGYRTRQGYGQVSVHGKRKLAHRLVFEAVNGYAPDTVEHTCHTNSDCTAGNGCLHRRCVNPLHMMSVTQRENAALGHSYWATKKTCKWGHELTEDNVLIQKQSGGRTGTKRVCRQCARHHDRVRRTKQRAARDAKKASA